MPLEAIPWELAAAAAAAARENFANMKKVGSNRNKDSVQVSCIGPLRVFRTILGFHNFSVVEALIFAVVLQRFASKDDKKY
jgi:hypothetical protein